MPVRTAKVPKRRLTEAEMAAYLRKRLQDEGGNGPANAFVTQVRDAAGFNARRTLDAVSMSLWPSRGLWLTGYEIKCSRADWLNELKKPEKAEAFHGMLDFFYLVVADEDFVRPGELPETWGLLALRGERLVTVKPAPALRDLSAGTIPPGLGRSFLAALLRASNKTAATPAEIAAAREQATRDADAKAARQYERDREELKLLRSLVQDIEREAGVRLDKHGWGGVKGADLGRALKTVMAGEMAIAAAERALRGMRNTAFRTLEALDRELTDGGMPK